MGATGVRAATGATTSAADEAAFGELVDRHVDSVFEAAWDVLRERWVAADITAEVFSDAWDHQMYLPEDDGELADGLADAARHLATNRISSTAYDQAPGPYGRPDEPDDAPRLGPVLHSRIMSTLDSWGVPIPTSGPAHMAAGDHTGRRVALRLGVAALLVVGLLVGALTVLRDRDGNGIGGGVVTDGVSEDQDRSDEDRATDEDEAASATTAPSTTAATTTTTEDDDSAEGDDAPDDTPTSTAPPGGDHPGRSDTTATSAPATTTPQPTAPPTTSPPPPVVHNFGGTMTGDTCRNGEPELYLWWDTENATSARLRAEGGGSETVPVDGSYRACAESGTEWTLNVTNNAGTTTETITV